jgi:antagonist of KipI
MNFLVQSAGFLSSVQDLGRVGFRQGGVSVGGALDPHALRVANAMVGNDDQAAGVEVTFGKMRLRFEDQRIVSWCGGDFAVRINDDDLPPGHAGSVAKGDELLMTAPSAGSRAWLAISGGIDVPVVLGSRSTDLRGNFGGLQGRALRDGDVIPLGNSDLKIEASWKDRRISDWSAPAPWASTADGDRLLRIVRGAHWNEFTDNAQRSFITTPFLVTPESDRMGARLDGPELNRIDPADLLSEAVASGTLQVPPNGRPILLLGDCQTIGGYPKIAHVITVDLPIAAQLWPGDSVRFRELSLAEAQNLWREREEDFARFRVGLSLHFS